MSQNTTEDLVYRLLTRAEIRRQISTRKSVQEGKPDRIADLLEEAATRLVTLQIIYNESQGIDTDQKLIDMVESHRANIIK